MNKKFNIPSRLKRKELMVYQFEVSIILDLSTFVIKVGETDQESKGISTSLELAQTPIRYSMQERARVEKRGETKQLVEKMETLWRLILLLTALTNRQPLLRISFVHNPLSLFTRRIKSNARMGGEEGSEASTNPPLSLHLPSSFDLDVNRWNMRKNQGGKEGTGNGGESGVFTRGSRTHDEQERDTGCESYITSSQAVASASCATCIEA